MPHIDRVPHVKRYCTNCKKEIEVRFDNDEVCPVCEEETLLPPAEEARHDA